MHNDRTSPYDVAPRFPPPASLEPWPVDKVSFGPAVSAGIVAFFIFVAVVDGATRQDKADTESALWGCFIGSVIVSSIVYGLMYGHASAKADARARQSQASADRRNREWAIAEAKTVAAKANSLLTISYSIAAGIPRKLEEACRLIARAQTEFTDRAYGPFWDATERAAELLSETTDDLRAITANAKAYEETLQGWQHNFPRFPIAINALPNPTDAAVAIRLTVRKGQTNYEFASIWEHRKTRKVLIGGFRTIGEAIVGAAETVADAYAELGRSVSFSLDNIDSRMMETARHTARVVDLQQRLLSELKRV